MFKMDLEKAEEPEINCQHLLGHRKSKGIQKNKIYLCFIDFAKAIGSVNHSKMCKILKEMEIPGCLTSLLRNLYAAKKKNKTNKQTKKKQLEADIEQHSGSKLGQEYVKDVYCHLVYLTYIEYTM